MHQLRLNWDVCDYVFFECVFGLLKSRLCGAFCALRLKTNPVWFYRPCLTLYRPCLTTEYSVAGRPTLSCQLQLCRYFVRLESHSMLCCTNESGRTLPQSKPQTLIGVVGALHER